MRLKYYLRGLGLGIIFCTLFFMISIQLHGGIMTDERVIARAKELGMVIPEEDEPDTQIPETESAQPEDTTIQDDAVQDNARPEDIVQNDAAQDDVQQEEETEHAEDTTQSEDISGDAQQDHASLEDDVIFTVADGEVCRTAAEKLVACGLIADVDSFREYMKEKDYDGLIREGTYRIPAGADMDTIAKIITAQVPEAVVEENATPDSQ